MKKKIKIKREDICTLESKGKAFIDKEYNNTDKKKKKHTITAKNWKVNELTK